MLGTDEAHKWIMDQICTSSACPYAPRASLTHIHIVHAELQRISHTHYARAPLTSLNCSFNIRLGSCSSSLRPSFPTVPCQPRSDLARTRILTLGQDIQLLPLDPRLFDGGADVLACFVGVGAVEVAVAGAEGGLDGVRAVAAVETGSWRGLEIRLRTG